MQITRRRLLPLLLIAPAWPARAHHGWSSFDLQQPLYVEGKAVQVSWRNPHAEFVIELPETPVLPADLARRSLPAQAAPVDGPALLRTARLPRRKERRWEVELAPISRMEAWKVEPIQPGQTVAVLGYTFPDEKGKALIRAEFLWIGEKVYALRSSPA